MKTDTIISIMLLSIWSLLLALGILTLIQPDWLIDLSHKGKNVEAISLKDAGDNFLKEGKFQQAIAQYEKALKIVPDNKGALANIAIAYQSIRRFKEAISYYNQLLELNPEYPSIIYYNVAEIFNNLNKKDKSLNYYKKSASLAFDPENAYQKIGAIYMDNKVCDSSIYYFELALKNKKTIENSYKSTLQKNLKHYGDTSIIYQEINNLLIESSKPDFFSDYDYQIYNTMLYDDINLVKTYGNIGYCLAINKKYEESIVYLKKALQINPGFIDARNNLRAVEKLINDK